MPVLLVAGGIGITPFLSQLRDVAGEAVPRDIVLVYAVSSTAELAYVDVLARTGFPVYLVSPDEPGELPISWRWVGPGPLSAELLDAAVPDIRMRVAYVSGSPQLVGTLRPALRRLHARRVTTDAFSGY